MATLGSTLSSVDLSDLLGGSTKYVATQFDKTDTSLTTGVTNLSVTLTNGRSYEFEAILYTTSNVAGGVKFAIGNGAAGISATAIIYEAVVFSAAGVAAEGRTTASDAAVGSVTAVTAALCRITGTIINYTSGGPLKVLFACNVAVGTSSVLVGSTFTVNDIT